MTLTASLSLAEIYHTTFDWPPDSEIQNRLMMPAGISEGETARKLLEYHRNIVRILPSYPKVLKVINADQPCVDVFYQGKPRWPLYPSCPCITSSGGIQGMPGSGGVKSWAAQGPCPETSVGSPRASPRRPWASTLHPEQSPDLTWSEERWGQGGRARDTQACPGTSRWSSGRTLPSSAGGPSLSPGQGTRSHMLQL